MKTIISIIAIATLSLTVASSNANEDVKKTKYVIQITPTPDTHINVNKPKYMMNINPIVNKNDKVVVK